MKAPREIRRWVNRLRKRYGRKNGVVSCGLFDNPEMERKWSNSKRAYRRNVDRTSDSPTATSE